METHIHGRVVVSCIHVVDRDQFPVGPVEKNGDAPCEECFHLVEGGRWTNSNVNMRVRSAVIVWRVRSRLAATIWRSFTRLGG